MSRAAPICERLAARYPLLYLVAGDVEDARKLVAGAAADCGMAVVAPRCGTGEAVPTVMAALAQILGQGQRTVLLADQGHRLLADGVMVRALAECLREIEKGGHCLVLLAPVAQPCPELDSERVVLSVSLPGRSELVGPIQAAFTSPTGQRDQQLIEDALHAAKGMTMAQLRRALRRVRLAGGVPSQAWIGNLRTEKRDLVGHSGILEIVENAPQLDAVGGLDALKDWLSRRRLALRDEARDFGLPPPRGVLLIGVQGCGKSLFAKATASELGLPLLRFDLGRLFSGDSGPDERLRQALAVTEAMAPVVLWVDEIDKSFASAMSGSGATARIFGTFITWLAEHKGGVFVAATANRVDHLPAELMRKGRFDETFFVDLPDVEVRVEVLSIHIRRSGRDPAKFDLATHAKTADRLTGAELEQAVVEALAMAFVERRELTDADINRALCETVPFVETYEEQVKELREWARRRARAAGRDRSLRDLFTDASGDGDEAWRR
jgi:hypothetical protein